MKENNRFAEIYDLVKLIPEGRVTSYGAIAKYFGSKSGARLVGWAMNAAHALSDVPAHRVVNRLGRLSGKFHFETPTTMQSRLEKEGIIIIDDQIENFDKIFWDPSLELL